MSEALPVLVDCVPYRARLSAAACADRWRIAHGKKASNETPGTGYAGIRQSQCRECEVGANRAGEEITRRRSLKKEVTKDLVVAGAPLAATESPKEIEMFHPKKCPDCKKTFTPTGSRQERCNDCRGVLVSKSVRGGQPKPPRVEPPLMLAPPPKPALTIYLEKQAAIEELKVKHGRELADAIADLEKFEDENYEVKDQARAVLERITGKQVA